MQRILRVLGVTVAGLYLAQTVVFGIANAGAWSAHSVLTLLGRVVLSALVVAVVLAMARVLDLLERVTARLERLEGPPRTNLG